MLLKALVQELRKGCALLELPPLSLQALRQAARAVWI